MAGLSKADKRELELLHNATPEILVDELGPLRQEIKRLQKRENILKEAIKGRLPDEEDEIEGENFTAAIIRTEQARLNTGLIREHMDEKWVTEHTTLVPMTQIRIKPKEEV